MDKLYWPEYSGKSVVEHATLLHDDEVFYGWPANHGAWSFGADNFLVGFACGKYAPGVSGMHKVSYPIIKGLLRTTDGWRSCTFDYPNDFSGDGPTPKPTAFSPVHEIYRVCGRYDHGEEACDQYGGIYSSRNDGNTWSGPFRFTGLEWLFMYGGWVNTARTCVMGNLIFLSAAVPSIFGSDFVICARIEYDGFKLLSVIKPFDGARCACPSAVLDNSGHIYVACRRRNFAKNLNWIELYRSDDAGLTWQSVSRVGSTGDHNGNPPSLAHLDDGRLICAFGNRAKREMTLAISKDEGKSWEHLIFRAAAAHHDFGYPQLFKRSDGAVVCVYYWRLFADAPASIQASYIYI